MDERLFLYMVNILSHIGALLRLIRWYNLLIVAATQVLLRECIIVPFLKHGYMEPQLPVSLFVLLVIATVFITAGGYAINDYFDRKMDRVNKPQSLIVGRLIYPRHAMAYHLFFSIAGIILGCWVALKSGQLFLGLLFFIVAGLLWFYSTTYKRELLLGNLVVALLTALVPFIVLLFELPLLARHYGSDASPIARNLMTWVLGFALFAFLLNLIREMMKDAEDFEGDQAYGKNTVAVTWGIKVSQWISVTLVFLTVVLLFLAWYFFVPDKITLAYFVVMLVIPLIISVILIFTSGGKKSWHSASTLLKLIMLAGLGYMIVANLIITYFS
jgi:4-hydroxybenzoate polyprenyltransferase